MRDPHYIIRRPLVTEKGTTLAEKANAYVFDVAPDANKVEISKAVEKLFAVSVVHVTTMLRKGKVKGLGWRSWQRPNVKRAMVKLKPGQTIEFI
ncbi:MAG: 50S ribosomal protein L23 [Planctomycetes bacterium]|nr:50S ribosomal protein L23 [Planctomycetota bacterium]